jgi:hypothetical protein
MGTAARNQLQPKEEAMQSCFSGSILTNKEMTGAMGTKGAGCSEVCHRLHLGKLGMSGVRKLSSKSLEQKSVEC